jgi:hypothetical protein
MTWNASIPPDELPRYCGSLQQLARITSFQLSEGREKGVQCLDFHTGSGFNFTVVPDRGMDIAHAEYKGRNLCWLSPAYVAAPQFHDPWESGWMRSFFGGLLTTCGLINVGIPDTYQDEHFGQHGRISNTPARHVAHDSLWLGGEYFLMCRGQVREARPMMYNLLLKRSIQTRAGDKHLRVHDVVVNEGFERVPLQILYHINVGYPVLDTTSYLLAPSKLIIPRDADSASAKDHHKFSQSPTPKYREKCYYHEMAPADDRRGWAALVNPDIDDGFGVYVKWRLDTLPLMTQWKMMGEGTYVMGLEPCNSYGIGFERQKELDVLASIDPGEHVDFYLEIGVLEGHNEIAEFQEQVSRVAPDQPEYSQPLL